MSTSSTGRRGCRVPLSVLPESPSRLARRAVRARGCPRRPCLRGAPVRASRQINVVAGSRRPDARKRSPAGRRRVAGVQLRVLDPRRASSAGTTRSFVAGFAAALSIRTARATPALHEPDVLRLALVRLATADGDEDHRRPRRPKQRALTSLRRIPATEGRARRSRRRGGRARGRPPRTPRRGHRRRAHRNCDRPARRAGARPSKRTRGARASIRRHVVVDSWTAPAVGTVTADTPLSTIAAIDGAGLTTSVPALVVRPSPRPAGRCGLRWSSSTNPGGRAAARLGRRTPPPDGRAAPRPPPPTLAARPGRARAAPAPVPRRRRRPRPPCHGSRAVRPRPAESTTSALQTSTRRGPAPRPRSDRGPGRGGNGRRAVRPGSLTPHPLHRFYACRPSKSSHAGPPDPEGANPRSRTAASPPGTPPFTVRRRCRTHDSGGLREGAQSCAQRCGLPVHARRAFLSCIGIQPHLIDKLRRCLWPSVITP